jgi:hypothetical protein
MILHPGTAGIVRTFFVRREPLPVVTIHWGQGIKVQPLISDQRQGREVQRKETDDRV